MGFYYGVLVIFLILAWSHLVTQLFYQTDAKSSTKNVSIDGLRGLLALGVFIAHSAISYRYYQSGVWLLPIENFYTMIGEGSVIFFFMITGFLFWNMIIRYRGELNPLIFIQHRVLRLVPMFLFSYIIIQLVAISFSHHSLAILLERSGEFLTHILKFDGTYIDITEIPDKLLINASVFWTLEFEWKFYLIILVLAFLYRTVLHHWIWLPFILVIVFRIIFGHSAIWMIFPFGMLAASIKHILDGHRIVLSLNQKKVLNFLAIPYLIFLITNFHDGYSLLWYTLGFILFLLIVCQYVDFFGLLNLRAAAFLGSISYSIYLLHGIWLYTVLHILQHYIIFKTLSLELYWSIIGIIGMVMIVSAALSYRFIEEKFYNMRTKMELPIK